MKNGLIITIIISVACCICLTTQAQFFSQKATEKKYMLAQIAALQTFVGFAKEGYRIVDGGLSTIQRIKDGDLNLHTIFLSGLKKVSPKIKGSASVMDFMEEQISMYTYCRRTIQVLKMEHSLSARDMAQIEKIYGSLLERILNDTELMLSYVSDGVFEMSDSDRLKNVDELCKRQEKTRVAVNSFTTGIKQYAQSSANRESDLLRFKRLLQ